MPPGSTVAGHTRTDTRTHTLVIDPCPGGATATLITTTSATNAGDDDDGDNDDDKVTPMIVTLRNTMDLDVLYTPRSIPVCVPTYVESI